MEEWGNKRSNEYYESNLSPSVIRPKEGDAVRVVERFIRDKYEHKKYIAPKIPPKTTATTEVESVPARRASTTVTVNRTAAPAPTPKPAPVPAPSLIDFMDDDPAPPAAPVHYQQQAISASNNGFDAFGSDDGFSAFTSAPPASVPTHNIPQVSDISNSTALLCCLEILLLNYILFI
jgi:hypothetical protein